MTTTSEPTWPCSIAVDVGGTFTDLVLIDGAGSLAAVKVPSVPLDPSEGVLNAVEQTALGFGLTANELLSNCGRFVHGSTVATNAVLEHKLAPVGLITTAGFRDALEIRRGIRQDQWDHRAPWPPVIVPRSRRLGVRGRFDHYGTELEPLNEQDVREALDTLRAEAVEAVAICLLHSYGNPAHEMRVAELARQHWPGDRAVMSSELVPQLGEYERTSTTVVNAGLIPLVGGYLGRLGGSLRDLGLVPPLLLLQSNGGTVPLDALASRPVDLMLSGPAAVGGALRRSAGGNADPMVSMEIGGTSCDVAVMVDSAVPVIDGLEVGGYHLNIPAVDVHTIGAGGGTLASVDNGGLLTVGPQGAGADPGPACYGRGGTVPTATDAHLLLGRLRSGPVPGGALHLDADLAAEAMTTHIAEPLNLELQAASIGVITLLEQHLRQAVETITIERGRDPARMTLVAAGGAGGLHGTSVARALGCRRLVIPSEAGVFCAIGMLNSDLRRDVSRSLLGPLDQLGASGLQEALITEQARADRLVAQEWPQDVPVSSSWYVDLRYPGQLWSVRVEVDRDLNPQSIRDGFESEYQRLYGHTQPGGVLEVTTVGVVMVGALPGVPETVMPTGESPTSETSHAEGQLHREERRCWLGPGTEPEAWRSVPIYAGAELRAGQIIDGPFLIEATTTTVLGTVGDRLTVKSNGDLEVELL